MNTNKTRDGPEFSDPARCNPLVSARPVGGSARPQLYYRC